MIKLPRVLFAPEFQDPERNRQSKLLHGFLWFALLIATAFAAAISILLPSNILRAVGILCFVAISSSICFPLIYRGKTRQASYWFVFLFWLVITVLSATGGGTAAPAFVGYIVVILSAGLLVGITPALIIGASCIVTEMVIAYAEANGLLPTTLVQQTVHTRLLAHILFFAFVAAIIFFYTRGIETSVFPSGSVSDDKTNAPRRMPTILFTIFVFFSVAIIATGYFYSNYQRGEFARSAEDDLLGIAKLKVSQIEDWRRERIGDAQVLSENSSFRDILQRYLLRPSDKTLRKELEQWLGSVQKNYGYSSIAFFDRTHTSRIQMGDYFPSRTLSRFTAMFDSALRSDKILFSDLHHISGSNQFRLDLFGRVFDHSGKKILGLLILQIDPNRLLFPLVQHLSVRSRTSESALVRQEGNDIVNVSALRFGDKDSTLWRTPASTSGGSGSRLFLGSQGVLRIVDYRGVPVFTATEKIPNFPWYLIVKQDEEEVYEPLRKNEWSVGLLIAFLILGAGGGVGFLWQSNSTSFYRRQYELETERRVLAQQFDYLTKYANDIIMLLDAQNRVVEANDRAVSAYGYSHEELIGIDARILRSPNELGKFETDVRKADTLEGAVFETVHRRKDGTTFPVEISTRIIEVDGKKFQQGIIRDITERKKAEEEVRQKEAELRFFAEATFEGIFFHQDERFVKMNDQFAQLVGYKPSELIGQPARLIIPPESLDIMQHHAKEKRSEPYEVALQRKDGSRWPAEIRGQLVTVEGRPLRQVVVRDLTEQKRAQQRLRESEQELKEAQHIALIGSSRWDAVTDTTVWSDELYRITGWDPSLTGPTNAERAKIYTPESYAVLQLAVARALKTGDPYDLELEIVRRDGELRYVLAKGRVIRNEQNSITGLLGTMQDITERKRSEEMIKEREVQYRELVETARDAIYTVSANGIFTSMNAAFETATGWKRDEWIGKPFADVLHPNDVPKILERLGRSISGEPQPLEEIRIKTGSGKYLLVELSTVPQTRKGKVVGVLGIGRDITERKQLEEQLRRTQRLDSIGSLASGIAHDLNNVLGPILLGVDVLSRKVTDESSKKILENLRNSSKRGSEIVKQVLAFARGTEQEYSPQQLRYVVNEIQSFVRQTFPKEIDLRINIPNDLPPIFGDSTQLHQILLNLCVNARDAMPLGGHIVISASIVDLSKSEVENFAGARVGAFICLSVSDTGTGIPEDIKAKIFDPFFTTKEVGKGTGLGLSTVSSIVRDHKGFIRIVSEVGRGTEFKIYFPAIDQKQIAIKPEEQPVPPKGNGEGVLVVDDEQSIVHIARETLEAYNYRVYTATDGVEATLVYNREPRGSIALVVSDINMPRMSGVDLAQILRNSDPNVRILMTSGSPAETAARRAELIRYEFLSKPFTADQLLRAIGKLLHETKNSNRST